MPDAPNPKGQEPTPGPVNAPVGGTAPVAPAGTPPGGAPTLGSTNPADRLKAETDEAYRKSAEATAATHANNPNLSPAAKQALKDQLKFSGKPGGPFNIDGAGFGTSGSVSIGGRQIPTTRWNDRSIKGSLPSDTPDGEVVVRTADGEKRIKR